MVGTTRDRYLEIGLALGKLSPQLRLTVWV